MPALILSLPLLLLTSSWNRRRDTRFALQKQDLLGGRVGGNHLHHTTCTTYHHGACRACRATAPPSCSHTAPLHCRTACYLTRLGHGTQPSGQQHWAPSGGGKAGEKRAGRRAWLATPAEAYSTPLLSLCLPPATASLPLPAFWAWEGMGPPAPACRTAAARLTPGWWDGRDGMVGASPPPLPPGGRLVVALPNLRV